MSRAHRKSCPPLPARAIRGTRAILGQVLKELETSRVSDTILTRAVFEFDNLASTFKTLKELGDICGPLIDRVILRSGYGDIQQFYTPIAPARLAALITNSAHVETVYDPTCGIGGALTAFQALRGHDDVKYSGQDINERVVTLARMRLLMYGVQRFDLHVGDTLTHPYTTDTLAQQLPLFDVVLADPPLGGKVAQVTTLDADPYSRFKFGRPSRRSLEWSFIQHVLASLKPQGIATVLTSAATLFRSGEEAQTRKNLINADRLEAVIALPSGVFAATSIVGYLLVFNASKPAARRNQVLFIDVSASPPGWGSGIKGEWAAEGFVEHALAAYRDDRLATELPVALIPKQVILENDADLSPKRYLSPAAPPVVPTLEQISVLQNQAQEAWGALEQSRVKAATAWLDVLGES